MGKVNTRAVFLMPPALTWTGRIYGVISPIELADEPATGNHSFPLLFYR
jgi:hypothetical protein